ncbi:energy-coupling factor transporter transmembrane protein EcfT [Mediterraneibacter gnavus]|uniref:Energy-coupling factor transporter transmembrane protein EcfT n=1 Tax=Mediterraneibacter gnavus TaxID=33038 RepID=A0A415S9F7_MEDGN|nr:energy-coupling factor transporter transmembrane protein EcfT [Mediterraneibacter gnavus]
MRKKRWDKLKDISIGQYFPGKSLVHNLDARTKVIVGLLYLLLLFTTSSIYSLFISLVYVLIAVALSKIPLNAMMRSIKSTMLILIVLSVLFNMILTDGEIILRIGLIKVTDKGIEAAVSISVRMVCMIFSTFILTYTTSIMEISYAVESILSPLKKFKIPVGDFTMIITIALRFIPVLSEEIDKIIDAQKARGACLDSGKLVVRVRNRIPIIIPLFMAAFQRADELTLAMECRGYGNRIIKTRLHKLQWKQSDSIILATSIIAILAAIIVDINLPSLF